MHIQLSDHFDYKKLLRFTFPSIVMLVFTSIYGVVDGYFVSNLVGKTPFAGFAIFGSGFFTALNDGLTSALISFLRTLLFQIAAVMLFPLIWEIDGIWISVVAAEAMAVVITGAFLIAKQKKYQY